MRVNIKISTEHLSPRQDGEVDEDDRHLEMVIYLIYNIL